MKRSGALCLVTILSVLAFVSMGSSVVFAQSPHFKKGGDPKCRDIGTQLECTGTLAGLGNEDLTIDLDANGLGSFACANPSGKESPGQNKVPFEVSGTQTISADAIKNGAVTFNVKAPATPPTATAEQAGCPNPNWSTRLTGLEFSFVDLTICQGEVLLFTCDTDPTNATIGSQFTTLVCDPAPPETLCP